MASPARRKTSTRPRQDVAAAEAIDFKAITDATQDIILYCDMTGVAHYVSPAARSVFGIEPEEMLGRLHIDRVLPEDRPKVMAANEAHRSGLADGIVTVRMLRADGSVAWIEGYGRAVRDPVTGEPSLVVVLRDISDRKALEAQLTLLALTGATPGTAVPQAERTGERSADGPKARPPRNVN